jgi:hypothetical protein
MVRLLCIATILGGMSFAPAYSATAQGTPPAAHAKTAQQERMTTCNQEAKGKTGDERKAFMSSCLKGEKAAPEKELTASQQRMKSCNAEASSKALKGDQRKAFMSNCLKAK